MIGDLKLGWAGLYCAVIVGLLGVTLVSLVDILQRKPLEDFAAAIEQGRIPKLLNQSFGERAWRLVDENASTCQRVPSLSRITVTLFMLRNSTDDSRTKDFERFETELNRALACNPFDGNLWLLEAMNRHRTGDNAGFVESWSRSIQVSPFEGKTLALRWELAPALLASGALPLSDDVHADLDRELRFAEPRQAGRTTWMLQQAQLLALAGRAIESLPSQRRMLIERNLNYWISQSRPKPEMSPFRSDEAG